LPSGWIPQCQQENTPAFRLVIRFDPHFRQFMTVSFKSRVRPDGHFAFEAQRNRPA
jgi:hypothetical protein